MAEVAATLTVERWLDEVILQASLTADVAGAPVSETIRLPAGLGDVAIMNVLLRATTIDSIPAANIMPLGVEVLVFNRGGTQVDHVGVAAWYLVSDTATSQRMCAYLDPDALVLWRQDEILTVTSAELDDDATPTGDITVVIKAVRVRPIEAPASNNIQLVR